MNVVVTAPKNDYTDRMLRRIQHLLQGHKVISWQPGEKAPLEPVDVLLAMGPVTRETMQALPGLALIQTLSDGYETVDVEAATELGIWVAYAPADVTGNGDSVAEYAVLLLLAAARRLGTQLASIRDQSIKKPGDAASLLGKTVCIVGVGSIGDKIAQRLVTFGVRTIGVDRAPLTAPKQIPTRPLDRIDDALAEADFVVLCIRATAENRHMFNAKTFAAMKPGAVLVNIARGSLVDEAALYDAVKSGHLAGAGLDVLEKEPVDAANALLTLPQIFVTPHEAGLTDLTIEGTAQFVQHTLLEFGAARKLKSMLNKPVKPRRAFKEE